MTSIISRDTGAPPSQSFLHEGGAALHGITIAGDYNVRQADDRDSGLIAQ